MTEKSLCGICGTAAPARFAVPRPEGAPDLDMRPGEPARSTLRQWVRVCRECDAAAPDLAALPKEMEAIVRSRLYQSCPGSAETLPFRRWALLSPSGAPDALLQASWAADDAGLSSEAVALRLAVAALWAGTDERQTACRRLDVLRRAGAFEEAERWLADISRWRNDDVTSDILAFQRARIEARDAAPYLLSAALHPPAHAPHVSHGKRARGGLLVRLLGR